MGLHVPVHEIQVPRHEARGHAVDGMDKIQRGCF